MLLRLTEIWDNVTYIMSHFFKSVIALSVLANSIAGSAIAEKHSKDVQLKFPGKSLGALLVGPNINDAQHVGQAKGLVQLTIPASNLLTLSVSGLLTENPELILQAPANGLDGLEVSLMDMDSERRSASDCLLKNITHFKNLRALKIGQSDITEKGIEYLSRETSLESVDIREANITANAIASLANLTQLKSLCLGIVTSNDLAMKGLPRLKHLSFIDLFGCEGLSNGTAEAISQLPELESVCLSRAKISDEGLQHFYKLDRLKHLFLDDTLITDTAIESLTKCGSLNYLNIGINPRITNRCVPALIKINSLKRLVVCRTKISWAGIERFKAMHLKTLTVDESQVPVSQKQAVKTLAETVSIVPAIDDHNKQINKEKTELLAPLH
jgi:hypothetical protein